MQSSCLQYITKFLSEPQPVDWYGNVIGPLVASILRTINVFIPRHFRSNFRVIDPLKSLQLCQKPHRVRDHVLEKPLALHNHPGSKIVRVVFGTVAVIISEEESEILSINWIDELLSSFIITLKRNEVFLRHAFKLAAEQSQAFRRGFDYFPKPWVNGCLQKHTP
jgi:hypothetical protein